MTDYKITLEVVRSPEFRLTGQYSIASAIQHVVGRFQEGDLDPDDESWPQITVRDIEIDGHEIHLSYTMDWKGPKDDRGFHRWICIAYQGARKLAEGFDTADVVTDALTELRARDGVPS